MGTDYGKRLRDRGIICAGISEAKGPRIFWLWQELDLEHRQAFCRKNGLMPPSPPEFKEVAYGAGKDAPRLFGLLWRELTNKQKRAFCLRAGLMPIPARQAADIPGQEQEGPHNEPGQDAE